MREARRKDWLQWVPALAPWLLYALALLLFGFPAHGQVRSTVHLSVEARVRSPLVSAVDSIGMTVSDMDRAIEFYSGVLTFEKVSDIEVAGKDIERLEGVFGARERIVRMKLGSEILELTEYLTPRGRPIPPDSRSNDRWFQHIAIIVSDMDKAYAVLRRHKVRHASTGPQRLPDWNKNAGGIEAFYFRDPDDHVVEILHFPVGKGSAKWHQPSDRLFLGIDHTAIVVSDTEAGLRFYRDTLGMQVAGESENYGDEQEHLNNVFGARLRITSLHAANGPSIELLQYLAPTDGRLTPQDSKATDLWHWQTRLVVSDPDEAQRAFAGFYDLISPGVVNMAAKSLGFSRGLTARDPDRHAVQVVR